MFEGNDIIVVGTPLPRIVDVDYLGEHRLRLQFDDGLEGDIDFAEDVKHYPYDCLADPKKFIQFGVTSGTLEWSDRLDIAPDELYERVKRSLDASAH